MRWLLAAGAVVAATVLFLLGRYGTLEVCEMARQDILRDLAAADIASAEIAFDLRRAQHTVPPGACLDALVKLHITDRK